MANTKFTPARVGDWIIFCDICGCKCWASESVLLDTYTGRGGLRVCPEDADPVDYGLVPYKIPAEKPVPFSRDTIHTGNPDAFETQHSPLDVSIFDPMGGITPEQMQTILLTWDLQNQETWASWELPWGLGGS